MASCDPNVEHFDSLKDATVTDKGTVQEIVLNVSPMKKGHSSMYFDAKITDGKNQIRVVGFSSSVHKRMVCLQENYKPVALENCKIKRGRYSEELEVMINPSTKLSLSWKRFDLKKITKMVEGGVSLCDVMSKSAHDKVTIREKVYVFNYL